MAAAKKATAKKASTPRPAGKPLAKAEADARCRELDNVAVAWVAAIRVKVVELAEELGRVSRFRNAGGSRMPGLTLDTVIRPASLISLIRGIEIAEQSLGDLLDLDTVCSIPDLLAAVRAAAEI